LLLLGDRDRRPRGAGIGDCSGPLNRPDTVMMEARAADNVRLSPPRLRRSLALSSRQSAAADGSRPVGSAPQ